MSATMNGKPMFGIGYGEVSQVGSILSIGERYCQSHLPQIPRLTRKQMMRLGCVFPATAVVRISKPRSQPGRKLMTEAESARIVELFTAGKNIAAIARLTQRSKPCVRAVVAANGLDPAANCCAANPMRPRIVALIREGMDPHDIATLTGAALTYVRTTASNLKRADMERGAA